MRSGSRLTAALIAVALAGAPATGFAAPDRGSPSTELASSPAPRAVSDADRYAAREVVDRSVAEFQGGESVMIIGASTVTLVLLIVLLVILL